MMIIVIVVIKIGLVQISRWSVNLKIPKMRNWCHVMCFKS